MAGGCLTRNGLARCAGMRALSGRVSTELLTAAGNRFMRPPCHCQHLFHTPTLPPWPSTSLIMPWKAMVAVWSLALHGGCSIAG